MMMAIVGSPVLAINGRVDGLVQPVKLIFKSARFSTEIIVRIIEFSKTVQTWHAHKLVTVHQYSPPNVIRAFAQRSLMSVTILAEGIVVIVVQAFSVMDIHAEM